MENKEEVEASQAMVVETSNSEKKRDNETTNSRSRSTRASKIPKWVDSERPAVTSSKKKPIESMTQSKKEEFDDMQWICAECKEAECMIQSAADQFLLCDGLCNRVFHYPCAGLAQLPSSEEEWKCRDCSQQQHQCAFCHEYGQDNVDVFLCRKPKCGLFFHESCLEIHNVELVMDTRPGPNSEDETRTVPAFVCPAHSCWTCTQKGAMKAEALEAAAQSKKKGRKKKAQSVYQCKTETRMFRCLYCPWAFHATCIPPMSRFHELAVLCHEHSQTHKLPDLDMSTSMQGTVEDKIDRTILKMKGTRKVRRRATGPAANPLFPGMRGDRMDSQEKLLLESVESTPSELTETTAPSFTGDLSFCLPVDIQKEVLSKPPGYTHVHGLRYNPQNKPKKAPRGGEKCHCVGTCGEDCFNRMTFIECFGEGASSNCFVGEACGNRSLGKRLFTKCKPKREGGKGWGLIAMENIPEGHLVQEYVGEVIPEAEKDQRLVEWAKEHPNDPNFYLMGLGSGWYVDAREYANMSRFINHSCDPNCRVSTINVKGLMRNGIYSKRDIAAGEFLSYDYQFDTKQPDKFLCRCGAKKCRGTMMGGVSAEVKRPLNWKEASRRYESDKALLKEVESKTVTSQVGALIPASEQSTEFVSSGPSERHRSSARRDRLFLWRNAKYGSDFLSRHSLLDARAGKAPSHAKESSETSKTIDVLAIIQKNHA